MTIPPASIGRYLLASLWAALPGIAVLAALILLGGIAVRPGLIAMACLAAGTLAVMALAFRDIEAIGAFLTRLSRGGPPERGPRPLTEPARSLSAAVLRMGRAVAQREQALASELAAMLSIVEAIPDPIFVLDGARVVVRANPAAREIFGEELAGRELAAVLRHPDILGAADAVLAGGGQRLLEYVQPVPVERTFEVRMTPFLAAGEGREPDEPAKRVLMTLHDITAIRRSEQMRADFVANASHELRTPLSALTGFIETLRGPARDDPEARERFLGIMQEQAGRMARLIADLLSLSRIELDEHTPPRGSADVVRVLEGVVRAVEMKAGKRGMGVLLRAEGDLPQVNGDADQLAQVFQNLIDNAINYGRRDTQVTVTAGVREKPPGMRGRAVAVTVADQGEGIARAHLPRLTERFYRVDPARSRAIGGTGLGLAIVKHIVNRHRGRLLIESEVGSGSSFTVLLPAPRRREA